MKKKFAVKQIVATAIGAALFFVLGRFVSVPSPVPNTNICLQYGVLAFIAAVFGPIVGLLTGLIGHFFIDLSWGDPWWSWIIASALFGLIMGFFRKALKVEEGGFTKKGIIVFNGAQVIAHLIAWVGIAPVLDILIYAEPADKVFTQGAMAAGANIVTTAIVGTLLLIVYAAAIPKKGSLKEED